MSYGPPPPPPHMQQGAFDDAVIMDRYDDDSDRRDNMDMFDNLFPNDNNNRNRRNGNKNAYDVKKPVVTRYEGYILQRERPTSGKGPGSWSNCTRQRMPYEQSELLTIAERHRRRDPNVTIHDYFRKLSSRQQEVVNDLIEFLRDKESQKNADWTIYDIYTERSPGSLFSKPEVRKLHVIFKRIDKNNKAVLQTLIKEGKDKTSNTKTKTTSKNANVIDIDEPERKTKKKETANSKQKLKRSNSYGDLPDPMVALGLGGFDSPPNNHSRQHSQVQQDFGLPPPPPPPNHNHNIPHGAIPVHPQMPPPPPPFYSARRANDDVPPFTPYSDVPAPIHIDSPQFNEPGWPHPHGHSSHHNTDPHQPRHRSHSLPRRPSLKRSHTSSQMRDIQNKLSSLALTLQQRPHNQYDDRVFDSDSSYDALDDDGTFSRPLSPTRSWDPTPPSSPRSHFSALRAGASLDRAKRRRPPHYYRGSDRYPHGRHSVDVDVIPAYSHPSSFRRSEDFTARPVRRRAITYDDDYPVRAPEPPRPGMGGRRYSEFDSGRGYRDREWRDEGRREWRDDGGGRRGSRYEEGYGGGGGRRERYH